jgi:hypothetical protein
VEELHGWFDRAIRNVSTRSSNPILTPGASTTASVALWPTTKRETHSRSKASPVMIHHANADFWNDYPASIRVRVRLLKSDPQHPSLQFNKLGDRNGQEIWSARVTLKYRVLALKLLDEYVWF